MNLSRAVIPWLAAGTLGPAQVAPVHHEASSTLTLRFEGSGPRTVDLRTIHGAIRVSAENRDNVQLSVTRTTTADSEADVATAERDVTLETNVQAATVRGIVHDRDDVCGEPTRRHDDSWWNRRRYDVTVDIVAAVPVGTRVRLCAVNGGSIVATGGLGDFDATNVNGPVEITGVRGAGRAQTVNGNVRVTFAASPGDRSQFKTVNGDVSVTFPADLSADLRLKTFHGDLLTDFDVQPLPPRGQPVRQEQHGRFVYRSGGFTTVRVARGGPELSFETLNGDVRVLRAAR